MNEEDEEWEEEGEQEEQQRCGRLHFVTITMYNHVTSLSTAEADSSSLCRARSPALPQRSLSSQLFKMIAVWFIKAWRAKIQTTPLSKKEKSERYREYEDVDGARSPYQKSSPNSLCLCLSFSL